VLAVRVRLVSANPTPSHWPLYPSFRLPSFPPLKPLAFLHPHLSSLVRPPIFPHKPLTHLQYERESEAISSGLLLNSRIVKPGPEA